MKPASITRLRESNKPKVEAKKRGLDSMKPAKAKKEYIVPEYKVCKARLPKVYKMDLAVWRLFIDFGIPKKVDEFYKNPATGSYHFISYEQD